MPLFQRAFFCILLLLFLSAAATSQAPSHNGKRPITFADMMALKRIGDPVISPDGRWVLFSAVDVNLEANTRTPHLWVVPLAGGAPKQLTTGAGEQRGRFSPDGKRVLFTAARDGESQLWIAEFDAASGALHGDARKLTALSTEAEGGLWSPDGQNILFISEVYPDCPDDACNRQRDEAKAKSKVKASTWDRLFYRHWSSYTRFKRSHLFVVPAAGGTPRDLTLGDHDVPPFNLGGQDFCAFSPDGKEVAYTSNIDEVEATSTNNELFVVPVSGGKPKQLTTNPGSDSTPLYSPDGKYIAYRAQFRGGYESDRFRLMLYERATGKHINLTENFDRWVGTIAWAPDSSKIYFAADDLGASPLYFVSASGGPVMEVLRGHNDDPQLTPDGKTLVFTRMSIEHPNELYQLDLAPVKPQPAVLYNPFAKAAAPQQKFPAEDAAVPLTRMNAAVFAQAHTSPLQPFWYTGAQNARVQGFLVTPPDFDKSKKYPVKFLIHGGPQGYWGDSWTYRWNAQLFAAGGYVVVMINPRGSTGYGQRFVDDINQDWGGRAYVDLMRGLDHVQRAFPFADTTRACAMGASFGGYMVNWINTQNTRFKCLVSHDGIFNTESAYGTSEELWFPEWEFGGTPWTNRRGYQKWSPHLQAEKMKTPTLVVHGQLDYRLDVAEGFQLFTTLQRMKVPSKMLYFPDEGHWVLKPQNSGHWYKTVNSWVDSYLKPEAAKP